MTECLMTMAIVLIIINCIYLTFVVGYIKGAMDCYKEFDKNKDNNEAPNKDNKN